MESLLSPENLLIGLQTVCSLNGILMVLLGVLLGILIGATPGMSPSMGVALLVPFSYGMNPALAFILFVSAYQAANYGGSITAIAINAPGTPASVVTAIDGYPLTQAGKPGKALGTAVFSSAIGGLIGAFILILCAIPIAVVGLKFGPAEYFSLALFGLGTVVAFGGSNWLKALIGILFGLIVSTIGLDPFTGEPRFTFGIVELYDGISFIPAMIGLFALGEIFSQIEAGLKKREGVEAFSGELPKKKEVWGIKNTILKSSIIGTFIGIIPGAGATISSFISYGEAKRSSKNSSEFGKGSLEGISASEAANSSSVGGALVPLLSLGIPGSATDAVLLGALTLHGLVAGPELFTSEPQLVYGIFVSLFLANAAILCFGLLGNKAWLKVISIPRSLLFPFIIVICILGSFTIKNSLFDSSICIVFGVLGWLFKRGGIKPAPVVLGLVLGKMLEENFRRALLIGGPGIFIEKPISAVFILLTLFSLVAPSLRKKSNSL